MRISIVTMSVFICAMFFVGAVAAKEKKKNIELPPDTIVVRHDTPPKMINEKKPEYPRPSIFFLPSLNLTTLPRKSEMDHGSGKSGE